MNPTVAFLLQVALILGAARIFGELMKRINQPPVLGELLAGILLGPSLLGWLAPDAFNAVFKSTSELGSLSTISLILLMLLTGLETDIRVIRNMGRAAFAASVCGMIVPFVSGLLLGMFLDESFVLKTRPLLALFLATAMAISAMPVIAKILLDLNMMRRNFGVVILSAAVVDDTVGWIILAFISGLVTQQSVDPQQSMDLIPFMLTLGWLALFLLAARFVIYPLVKWLLPIVEHELRMPGGELVLIVILALLMGAATEAMHVHAVFGAFIAGVILRQCPGLRAEELHRLEVVTMALFAPLFFGAVGLRVDFTKLQGFWLPVLVIAIAMTGKMIGCYIGGLIGRMPRWEALALGIGMSARGAMELVVAKIGLDLGILTPELFAIIVLMAIVTSFIAPIALKAIAHKLPLSEEEKLREKSAADGLIPSGQLKILLPAAGGGNAVLGCHIATHLCSNENDRCAALYIETERRPWFGLFRRSRAAVNTEAYFQSLKRAAGKFAERFTVRKVTAVGTVLATILDEAAKGYQFLFIGASGYGHPLYDPFISDIVSSSPCHIVVVSNKSQTESEVKPFQRILVPTNGSYYADAAFELAAHYAAATGAHITVLYVSEGRARNPLLPAAGIADVSEHTQDVMRVTLRQQFSERMTDPAKLECQIRESETVVSALKDEVADGHYDLVVFGAENKSLVERLYLGQHIEAALTEVDVAIAVVIPKVGGRRSRS